MQVRVQAANRIIRRRVYVQLKQSRAHVAKVFPMLGMNLGVRMVPANVEVVLPSPGPVL